MGGFMLAATASSIDVAVDSKWFLMSNRRCFSEKASGVIETSPDIHPALFPKKESATSTGFLHRKKW
eukprot:CAMPEP_0172676002 /NCGR_PEP_ID=MMETSP1074-20121228/13651_1 /TAXON_ID=2916 /ORGANISM="Ceratium fusus, Strain PA161109" /LENGTH=66 /DNA_ID=CAMNT_0013493555 /DNA_START=81 /DNA_END=281 /DNA_ORIENTATION=-